MKPKPLYQLHLITNNKRQDIDALFGIEIKTRNDYDAGWDHLAYDYKHLADFVFRVIYINDLGGKDVCRLTITKFGQRNDKSKLLCYLRAWDANDEEMSYINKGFKPTKRDHRRLISYISKKCDVIFKKEIKDAIFSKKRLKKLEKAIHKKRFENLK